jgi:hypothetical protein
MNWYPKDLKEYVVINGDGLNAGTSEIPADARLFIDTIIEANDVPGFTAEKDVYMPTAAKIIARMQDKSQFAKFKFVVVNNKQESNLTFQVGTGITMPYNSVNIKTTQAFVGLITSKNATNDLLKTVLIYPSGAPASHST